MRKKRWCAPCGKPHGAVSLESQRKTPQTSKKCESCGEKRAGYGLETDPIRKKRIRCGRSESHHHGAPPVGSRTGR